MNEVEEHYGTQDLTQAVTDALEKNGLGGNGLALSALEPLDQFHVGGHLATSFMVGQLPLTADSRVLDIGSGLGGPARFTANEYGCAVTGIDLSAPFVAVANLLSERASFRGKVDFEVADALQLPFTPQSFDHAFTQHVAMSIKDRHGLYSGIAKVLKPKGRLAIYDVVIGNGEEVIYPTPWSRTGATSFLLTPSAMKDALVRAGFEEISWNDKSAEGLQWFQEQAALMGAQKGPIFGLPVVMGADFPVMAQNFAKNLKLGRIKLVQAVFQARL